MKKILLLIGLVLGTGFIFAFSLLKYTEKKLADENSLLGIMYQQNAAEYEALCLQAYHMARVQAEYAWATNKDHNHLAIVTDLDETALDNTPGEAFDYQQDKPFEISSWWLHGRPRAVPGAVEFFNWAHEKGFHIYYVSNRPNMPAIIDSTREQMKLLGFPLTATAKDDRYFMFAPKGVSTKQPRRDSITNVLKDNIILLLGDNLPDLSSEFDKVDGKYLADTIRWAIAKRMKDSWGSKLIVLPNAYYGDWESTYYQSYRDANPDSVVTIQKKYAIREGILKTYDFIKSK